MVYTIRDALSAADVVDSERPPALSEVDTFPGPYVMTDQDNFDSRKARASAWFEDLRNQICAAFEGLEDAQDWGPHADLPAGRFVQKETHRASDGEEDAGGGGTSGHGHRGTSSRVVR